MRRTNKSHKVPNVKLRPPQAPERRSRDRDAPWPDNSSDSEVPPSASMADLCPRPFKGVTLCATGQIDKSTLFKQAFELGALSTSDFTDKVTHLVANTHGGAKYMCALERKIPIMTPEWIHESYAIWLRGDDVNFEESLSKYRLPAFSGVVLSFSGIDALDRRTEINRLLTAQQGVYLKNLERPVKVTHLLCSGDEETDKMRYAEKFNQRGEANIHLVWEEWFWDCLEFGGRFDERKYYVNRPRPERRSLHEVPPSTPIAIPDIQKDLDRSSNSLLQAQAGAQVPPPRSTFAVINHLSTELEEEEEVAAIKPTPAPTLHLWQSLLKSRSFEMDRGKLVRSPSKSQASRSDPVRPRPPLKGVVNGKGKEKESVISTFRRTSSFAHIQQEPSIRQPFRRETSFSAQGPEDAEGSTAKHPIIQEVSSIATLFAGRTFRLLGEARCPNVRSAIEGCSGVVTDDDTAEVDFIIVRLISGSKLYRDETDSIERAKYRTECWLEHSVFLERICAPEDNVSFTPLGIPTPIPNAENIVLSLSGLNQSDLCWIRRLLRALGITLAQSFSRRSTHLLCPSGSGAKFDKALEWRIAVVSMGWLNYMAREGSIPDISQYLVSELQRDIGVVGDRESAAVDVAMTDDALNDHISQPLFVKKPDLLQDNTHDSLSSSEPQHEQLPPSSSPNQLPPQSSSPALNFCPTPPVEPIRQLTQTPIQLPPTLPSSDINGRIPSSTTPSPMKLLPSSIPGETPTPERPPGLGDVAKALERTLTTLLGKRTSDEEDTLQTRKGKRPRPQPPSKIKPRRESHDSISSLPRPVHSPELDNSCYEDINLLEAIQPADESMRVTYEDPVQLEERRRLMMLLGVEPPDSGETLGRKRRSATRAGGSRHP
ncbi:hypothetical protein J3A83DRAFT_4259044 [Scleroderma citrinum]